MLRGFRRAAADGLKVYAFRKIMEASRAIAMIEAWMEEGKAYAMTTDVGTFILLQRAKIKLTTDLVVQYPILKDRYRADDFPVWAPYHDGKLSPYGRGHATANIHLVEV